MRNRSRKKTLERLAWQGTQLINCWSVRRLKWRFSTWKTLARNTNLCAFSFCGSNFQRTATGSSTFSRAALGGMKTETIRARPPLSSILNAPPQCIMLRTQLQVLSSRYLHRGNELCSSNRSRLEERLTHVAIVSIFLCESPRIKKHVTLIVRSCGSLFDSILVDPWMFRFSILLSFWLEDKVLTIFENIFTMKMRIYN